MVRTKQIGLGICFLVVIAIAYYLGQRTAPSEIVETDNKPKNIEEIVKLESDFKNRQANLDNRVSEVRNKIETVKLNLGIGELDAATDSSEIGQRLRELDERLANMTADNTDSGVPIPPDSPSGKIQNQPRTASGIPVSVLDNYQQETGVTAEEIEELMRRE